MRVCLNVYVHVWVFECVSVCVRARACPTKTLSPSLEGTERSSSETGEEAPAACGKEGLLPGTAPHCRHLPTPCPGPVPTLLPAQPLATAMQAALAVLHPFRASCLPRKWTELLETRDPHSGMGFRQGPPRPWPKSCLLKRNKVLFWAPETGTVGWSPVPQPPRHVMPSRTHAAGSPQPASTRSQRWASVTECLKRGGNRITQPRPPTRATAGPPEKGLSR